MKHSFMHNEINQQPGIICEQAAGWTQRGQMLRALLLSRRQVILVGRGSSGNAALYFTYLWSTSSGRQPMDFRLWIAQDDNDIGDYADCAVVAYSASGQSTDVVKACQWLKKRGALVLGVTAAEDSNCRLGSVCDELFLLNCGIEKAVPATKSFTSQMAASAVLSGFPFATRAPLIAQTMERVIAGALAEQLATFISGARTVIMLGRGHVLGAVHDAALKLQETTALASFAYSTAEFFHGPMGCVVPEDRIIIFSSGDSSDLEGRLLVSLAQRGVPVRLVAGEHTIPSSLAELITHLTKSVSNTQFQFIERPATGEDWSDAFVLIALIQMTCVALCERMGRSPDAPPALKKVTET